MKSEMQYIKEQWTLYRAMYKKYNADEIRDMMARAKENDRGLIGSSGGHRLQWMRDNGIL